MSKTTECIDNGFTGVISPDWNFIHGSGSGITNGEMTGP